MPERSARLKLYRRVVRLEQRLEALDLYVHALENSMEVGWERKAQQRQER